VEGDREQALLAARGHLAVDVEERPGADAAVLEHDDLPVLEHDVDPPALVPRRRDVYRRVEPAGYLLETKLWGVRPCARARPREELVAEEPQDGERDAERDDLA
jgi:hypothetical protein